MSLKNGLLKTDGRRAQRRFLGVCAVAVLRTLQACGGGGGDDETATVYFEPDTATCVAADWQLEMYIDGSLVGTELVEVGKKSSAFETKPGNRTISAIETRSGKRFGPWSQELEPGMTFTLKMVCA